ncbi:MAG: hypothetical protein LBB57_00440 [Clostridiales Family XIII bacterium]|jgi:hypothetical protein|nr:hypothetical protein [Clostridiales Family XIII bacterium]
MQKIKDILYDTNDLLVALLIIALAALLIRDRIDVILDYPSVNASGAAYEENGGPLAGEEDAGAVLTPDGDAEATSNGDAAAGDAGAETGGASAETGGAATDETPAATGADEPVQYSLYIAYGETAAQIAQKLLNAGMIKDVNDFYDALLAADAATRLQAGTFNITEGATLAEIVNILTGH